MRKISELLNVAKVTMEYLNQGFPDSLIIKRTGSGIPMQIIIPNKKFKFLIYYKINTIFILCSDYYVYNSDEYNDSLIGLRAAFSDIEFRSDLRLASSMYSPLIDEPKISLGIKKMSSNEIWNTNHQNIRKIYTTKQLLQTQIQ